MAAGSQAEHVVAVESLAHGGYGVARIEGRVCFVAHGLPGDCARVSIERAAKGVLWARIVELLEPSPHREAAPCPAFGICGGCSWLHFEYNAQLAWKRRIVQDCLRRIARIEVEPDVASDPLLRRGYRTRAEFHCDGIRWGFCAGRSHEVVDTTGCPLCHPRLNAALERLRTVQVQASVEVTVHPDSDDVLVWAREQPRRTARPSPATRAGRGGRRGGGRSACDIVRKVFPCAQGPGETGLRTAFTFDDVPIVNGTFSQASLLLNRLLTKTVRAAVGDAHSVLDLYCGTGNLSLSLAETGRTVLGIDHNAAAIGAIAALGKGTYIVGDEYRFREALAEGPWDAVILDPPREGARSIAPALAGASADRVVYVSCDPATLARDAAVLGEEGWSPVGCTVIDLFPDTPHVETVLAFGRP